MTPIYDIVESVCIWKRKYCCIIFSAYSKYSRGGGRGGCKVLKEGPPPKKNLVALLALSVEWKNVLCNLMKRSEHTIV